MSLELAKRIRSHALRMVHGAMASHIGSCLSVADILAVLYSDILHVDPDNPSLEGRDRLIFSKGHAAAALYAVLAERGFFPVERLAHYCEKGSHLLGHATGGAVPGVEVSTGSLGHGLPIACGMALAARADGRTYRTFAVLSDGELDEGSSWEAFLFAAHHGLEHLVAVVDYNRMQALGSTSDVLELEPLAGKLKAFGWSVREIDGHDHREVRSALQGVPFEPGRPSAIVARTVKGKGVGCMEDELLWHYRPPDEEELAEALREVGER